MQPWGPPDLPEFAGTFQHIRDQCESALEASDADRPSSRRLDRTCAQEYLANTVVPYELRLGLWRTWGSLLSILPVGGESIWGNLTYTPDVEASAPPLRTPSASHAVCRNMFMVRVAW